MRTYDTPEQVTRRVAELSAVQGAAGVGLTVGDVDLILDFVRIGGWPVGQVADVLRPDWRELGPVAQNVTVERAARVIASVHTAHANVPDA